MGLDDIGTWASLNLFFSFFDRRHCAAILDTLRCSSLKEREKFKLMTLRLKTNLFTT